MLIVIEGLDASGKTTQTKLLVDRLEQESCKVYTLDFPQYTNNVFGKILKQFLSNDFGNSVALDPKLSALLFAGDRYESKKLLDSWLSDPDAIVVLNRYTPSNIAYNMAKSVNNESAAEIRLFIEMLEYQLLDLPRPDLVLVLGSSSAITKARLQVNSQRDSMRTTSDAYESDLTFLDKVAQQYVSLCCDTKTNTGSGVWKLLEITQDESIESVHQRIWNTIVREAQTKTVLDKQVNELELVPREEPIPMFINEQINSEWWKKATIKNSCLYCQGPCICMTDEEEHTLRMKAKEEHTLRMKAEEEQRIQK